MVVFVFIASTFVVVLISWVFSLRRKLWFISYFVVIQGIFSRVYTCINIHVLGHPRPVWGLWVWGSRYRVYTSIYSLTGHYFPLLKIFFHACPHAHIKRVGVRAYLWYICVCLHTVSSAIVWAHACYYVWVYSVQICICCVCVLVLAFMYDLTSIKLILSILEVVYVGIGECV